MNKVRLIDICQPKQWKTIPTSQLTKEGYPVYGANGKIGFYSEYNHEKETILITCRGATCGSLNISEPFSYVNGNAMCLDNLDDRVSLKYLYYNLCGYNFTKVISGTAQPQITGEGLSKVYLAIHDTNEQQRIVSVFDKLERIILSHKQYIQKLDELIKSRFVEMFGDPIANTSDYNTAKLRNLSIKICDGVHAKPEYTDTGRPFLSVVNINRRTVDFSNCKFVSEEAYQKMIKSTHPEKGDILYTKVGATYGIPAYVDTDIAFCLYVSVCLIKPRHELINSKFLAIQMDMPFVKYQADKRIKGIGVPDLHLNQISEFEIILPPRELQNQFADFVSQVEKQKATIQQSIDKLETLKKSLMQEYFG